MENSAARPIHNIGKTIVLLCMACASLCHAQTSAESAPAASAEQAAPAKMTESASDPVVLASAAPSMHPDASPLTSEQQQAQRDRLLADSLTAEGISPEKKAMTAAVADGVTTGLALSLGAVESNPVIGGSPLGLVAATGVKFAILKYADSMPQEQKRFTLKTSSAVWGGAAVNNILVLFAAPPPAPLIAGLLMGFFTWKQMSDQYAEEDRVAAERNKQHQPQEDSVAVLNNGSTSSGQ